MAPIPQPPDLTSLLSPREPTPSLEPSSTSIPHLLRRALAHLRPRSLGTTQPNPSLSIRSLKSVLVPRQQVFSIPSSYSGLNDGPAPGAVAGIVVGSVAGFLLILWLIYTCFGLGGGGAVVEEEVITHREHRRSPRRSHSSRRSEVIEVHRSRSPPPRSRRETIVVEERRTSTAPPVVEAEDDDIVEVIEEHSPPRRMRRSGSGRQSGFRTVDPGEYAGGGRPLRKVSRR